MRLTPELIQLAKVSPRAHFEACVQIENKNKQRERPTANVFQQRLFHAYEVMLPIAMKHKLQVRIIGLKIRQCGGTTASSHILYHHSQRFRCDSIVMANVKDNSAEILNKVKLFNETDVIDWGNRLNPLSKKLEWLSGSRAEITSAEVVNPGISRTRQFGLFSEAAKYPRGGVKDDKQLMASMLPSLSGDGTIGIAESTPEGASGWFFDQYGGALTLDDYLDELAKGNPKPGNGWIKVFAAWHEFEANTLNVSKGEAERIQRTLTPREFNGREKYGWTIGQIAWRRAVMESECGGSETLFDEFYPEDEISCFLASGRPRFNMGSLVRMESAARLVNWSEGNLSLQETGKVVFTQDTGGYAPVLIREMPKPGCKYIVWCDPMTGIDQAEGDDPDAHSIGVLRLGYDMDGELSPDTVVARVRAPWQGEADTTAEFIEGLSKLYGNAIVALEVNQGLHILEHLKARGVPLFRREVIDPYDRDAERFMFGFKLKDADLRRSVIDALAMAIRDGTIDLDLHTIAECKTFVVNKNGKAEARSGCHDDDVMGVGMAHYAKGSATVYTGEVRKRRKPADWRNWKRGPIA